MIILLKTEKSKNKNKKSLIISEKKSVISFKYCYHSRPTAAILLNPEYVLIPLSKRYV